MVQEILLRPKNMDSETIHQATEPNPAISTLRELDKLGISQSSVRNHLHISKGIQSCQIVPHITKILQNLTHLSNKSKYGVEFWDEQLLFHKLFRHILSFLSPSFGQYIENSDKTKRKLIQVSHGIINQRIKIVSLSAN